MYDRSGVGRDINVDDWNHRGRVIHSYWPAYVDAVGPMDMPVVRHEDESYLMFYFAMYKDGL